MKPQTPELLAILQDRLTLGYYGLGDKLRPAGLAREFGVSSNTAREVMLRLSGTGLLTYTDQRGFRVRAQSPQRLHELTEFRIMLEQQGATRSIERGGLEWEAALTAAHHKLSHIEARIGNARDIVPLLKTWNAAELGFHLALSGAAQLPILLTTFETVFAQFRQQILQPDRGYSHHGANISEHQRIVEAALDRDAPACCQAIHDHMARNLAQGTAAG